ncbi:hypothetical protein RYH80_11495 [Halobaculum sp. MBLA0147]|uniref:hypothetical protein n=1 Tax=Halobaculum sp. MBLA0147 TaxID=3079934 RepID=UPI003523720D
MSDESRTSSRRTVLKLLGSGAVAAGTAPRLVRAAADAVVAETLRGNSGKPLKHEQIRAVRRRFAAKHAPRDGGRPQVAFTDLSETIGDSRVMAYNVVSDGSGAPREQFATRDGPADAPGVGSERSDRLHEKADEMLADAKAAAESSGGLSIQSTGDNWSDWYQYGSTDLYHEFPKMGDYDVRPGNVKFVNDVRKAPDQDRAGARVKLRMEPGRQVCNDGFDGYCSPTIQDGYKNKRAVIFQDWDQPVNSTPTEDLLTDTDPEGQISDVTTTRSVSLGLEASKSGVAASVGYSSSVTLPAAELVDATTLAAGESEHKFDVNSPKSNSSTYNAVFEVGSASRWTPDCAADGRATRRVMLDVHVDLQWGLDTPLTAWGDVISDDKSFTYVTYC